MYDVTTWDSIKTFLGHTGSVYSVAFSPDNSRILTGSFDKTVQLWDANSGELIRIFSGHTSSVNSVAFSPDGLKGLSGSNDKTARLWDLSDGTLLRTFSGHKDFVMSARFSSDGQKVLSASWDGTAMVWDISNVTLVSQLHTLSNCKGVKVKVSHNVLEVRYTSLHYQQNGFFLLHDLFGRTICQFTIKERAQNGYFQYALPPNLAKGIYCYRLKINSVILTDNLVLMR